MINFHQLEAGYLLNRLFSFFPSSNAGFQSFLFIVFPYLVGIICSILIFWILRTVLQFRKSIQEASVLLELTPPSKTEQDSYTTEQLFSLIHSLGNHRSFKDKLLGNKTQFSLEIVSTQHDGIRYLIRTIPKEVNTLKRNLLSYLPQLSVKIVSDYLPERIEKDSYCKVVEFKLSHHFAYPLKRQDELIKHDPIAYITGMMTKLSPDEVISLQILVSSAKPKEARKIANLILYNGDLLEYLNSFKTPSYLVIPAFFLKVFLILIYLVAMVPLWALASLRHGDVPLPQMPFSAPKLKREKTQYEQDLISSINTKLDQPLFETTIRLLVVVNNRKDLSERVRGFISSFASFSGAGDQTIITQKRFNLSVLKKIFYFTFKKRLTIFSPKLLLSISEISDIYHFPFTRTTKTEDIVKMHSKQLPAPLSLKRADNLDITFAKNFYGGSTTMIGLNQEERRRHMYIIGATGTGKSTLLLSMITQDIKNGKGLAVLDPHGDLIEKILPTIPENRMKDVIYFNPDDVSYPIGINLLELSTGLSDDDSLREREFITESIISLFHKLYTEKYSGPRMEYILRNTIHTAFTVPGSTLFTVYKLLINTPFRKQVTAGLTDENLKDFWKYEFSKAGDYQKVKMISPITNKIGRFLFSPVVKRILEQEKSSINFDDIMDSGKILLCNLSKGRIGEDTSNVFGVLLMTKIQLAALKRARTEAEERRDFYLYVDEFQNFATPAFAQILSEARKYRLNAILAHQTTSQLEDKSLVQVTLANTGTIICFRTANPEDEKLLLPQFYPYIQQGEIANLPSFHFYMKNNALNPEEPFSGETMSIGININKNKIIEIVKESRNRYAKKYTFTPSEKKKIISQNDNFTTEPITANILP